MPITVIKLPSRATATAFSQEDQEATLEALANLEAGEGVQIDEAQDTENKARVRARAMARLIENRVAEGYKVRVHTVKSVTGQGATKRTKYTPAVSLVEDKSAPAED